MWLDTRYLRMAACHARRSGADGQLRRIFRVFVTLSLVAEPTHLGETEKVGDDGFATSVLVGAIRVQPITAAAGFRIDQRQRKIVAAAEPCERPLRVGSPGDIAVGSPRGEACGDRCGGFQGLLIEGQRTRPLGAEASRADWSEKPCRRRLLAHEPAQGS